MGKLQVRNLTIGEGRPKICVPIVGQDEEEILQAAGSLKGHACDLVEWRGDFYRDFQDIRKTGEVFAEIKRMSWRDTSFIHLANQSGGRKCPGRCG